MQKQELKDKISEIANSINELSKNDLDEKNNAKTALEKSKELNDLLAIFNYLSENPNIISRNSSLNISSEIEEVIETSIPIEEINKSINSKLANTDYSGNTLNKKTISNLSSSIGINERFLLIKDLFQGSTKKFNDSIHLLNSCKNKEEANELIYSTMRNEYGWEDESEALTILSDLIENRFSH